MTLNREQLKSHAGMFETHEVHVPAWAENGDDVIHVRGMTLREFEINQSASKTGEINANVIVKCVLDDQGGRLLNKDDVSWVSEWQAGEALPIVNAISKASGLDPDDDEDDATEAAVARAEGNSEETQSSDSVST